MIKRWYLPLGVCAFFGGLGGFVGHPAWGGLLSFALGGIILAFGNAGEKVDAKRGG